MSTRILRKVFPAGLAVVALAAPAAAPAAVNVGDVRQHVRSADSALARVEALVNRNADARAAVQMARANVEARRAAGDARRVRGKARKSQATKVVARQFAQNSSTFAEQLDEVRGGKQDEVANAVTSAVNGRQHAIAQLASLLERVPAAAVPGLTRAIAAITAGSDEAETLAVALDSGEVSSQASDEVERAIARAEAAIAKALAKLRGLVEGLPAQAQPHVQQAIDRVTGALEGLLGSLPVPGGSPGGLPVPFSLGG